MISPFWSYALTVIGLAGQYLVYRNSTGLTGPIVGISVQAPWLVYAIATGQHGFIASSIAYAAINVYGLRTRLSKEKVNAQG